MSEILLKDLTAPQRELLDRGKAAVAKENWDYAITLLMSLVRQAPAFYPGREILRGVQLKKAQGKTGFLKKMFGTAGKSPQLAKAQVALRTSPVDALAPVEEVLCENPHNLVAHRLMADAATACGFLKTAVLSLEIVVKQEPEDRGSAMKLARALLESGNANRSIAVLRELEKVYPDDPEIAQTLKNTVAKRTMADGGYEGLEDGQGSYRTILKDEQESIALEQGDRLVKDEETARSLLDELRSRLEDDGENIPLNLRAARLAVTAGLIEEGLQFYGNIVALGASDAGIETEMTKARVAGIEAEIEALPAGGEGSESAREALMAKKETVILEDCEKRVAKYPNDLHLHFELGELYFQRGRVGEAIKEFQKAQNNPSRRICSLLRLGQLFQKRKMYDLASRSLKAAIDEKEVFDEEKKELCYTLGTVFEAMNQPDEAIEMYKRVYEVDIDYRDVAAKVDAYYEAMEG